MAFRKYQWSSNIPAKKENHKWTPDQQEIRTNAALNDYKTEIELLKLRTDQNKGQYEQTDKEMSDFVKEKSSGLTKLILSNIWEQETIRNESTSKRRWRENESR